MEVSRLRDATRIAMREVDRHFYATVVREIIYHENDLTNHCIMWLLIVQR
jgi:hypothetical protein